MESARARLQLTHLARGQLGGAATRPLRQQRRPATAQLNHGLPASDRGIGTRRTHRPEAGTSHGPMT
jgi:hypothetical protein